MRVDTLSLAERLSFHTNMVDWTLLTPNAGVEFDVRSTNWNRWAVGLDLRYNWQTKHTFKSGLVYNIMGARLYFRNYWRPRQIGDEGVGRHTRFIDRVFSCRRTRVKHPGLLFYRGAYLSYNKFSIKLLGSEGYQGSAVTAGFTYGIVKPLYVFTNGNSLDFDLGVSAGLAFASYDNYRHDRESDCYPVTKRSQSGVHPVVSDLHVGFVYRLGSYPVTKKYRWRYDCDQVYRDRIDSIYAAKEKAAADKRYNDSLTAVVSKDFWHHYDSIMSVKKKETDSLNRVKTAAAAAAAQARQAEKERERQARLDAKAAAKTAKAAAKTPADSTALATDSLSSGIVTSDSLSITASSGEAAAPSDSTAVPSDSIMTAPVDSTATPPADSQESESTEDTASGDSTSADGAETESTEVAPATEAEGTPAPAEESPAAPSEEAAEPEETPAPVEESTSATSEDAAEPEAEPTPSEDSSVSEAEEPPATSEEPASETPLEQTSETSQGKEAAE
ncbi:MAG: DUF3575 domain-containing protein [Prevotella sp.]|nr:DUF3575 domain-containing protein [Prevotella sp.]